MSNEGDYKVRKVDDKYEGRWILHFSVPFHDELQREKFFVIYIEHPNTWRRLTITLSYQNAPPDSLEADISGLHSSAEKSFLIYNAIRYHLGDIEYYDTVTNLKLETWLKDNHLHVHVREDINEIIQFPAISRFASFQVPSILESECRFLRQLSGFVYLVSRNDSILVKRDISGPDALDEFSYEVNALQTLRGRKHIIQLEGLVTDESGLVFKGMFTSYASQGALTELICDQCTSAQVPWSRREKWAKQIVQGLHDIHQAGVVHGNFTLSNITINGDDDVQIINMNRRGCPVGWEPPEFELLIKNKQRVGMHIDVKSDIFQLGMVLWALAKGTNEPERMQRPLFRVGDNVPLYFIEMVKTCLSLHPQERKSAEQLLMEWPTENLRVDRSDTRDL